MQRLITKLEIVNVVATAELRQLVHLKSLTSEKGFLYDQDVYHCAYLKDSSTRGKISIFASGKMISIGTKSLQSAKHDLNVAVGRLEELGLITHTRIKVRLQNIVATADLGSPINVNNLAKLPHVIYEPEQFPGAIYYAHELEGASTLIFPNGKIVVAGLKHSYLLGIGATLMGELAQLLLS